MPAGASSGRFTSSLRGLCTRLTAGTAWWLLAGAPVGSAFLPSGFLPVARSFTAGLSRQPGILFAKTGSSSHDRTGNSSGFLDVFISFNTGGRPFIPMAEARGFPAENW